MVQAALQAGPQPLRFTLPDKKAAEAMRLNFYGLRGAISREGGGEAGGLFSGFMDSQLTIRENQYGGWELCLAPPEFQDAVAQAALRAALDGLPPIPANPAIPLSGPAEPAWTPPPPKADPYAAYLITKPSEATPPPPVDPFDLTETRTKIDTFTAAVSEWLRVEK